MINSKKLEFIYMYVWEHVRTHYTDGDFWRREHHGMFLSRGLKWYWGKIISPETIIAGHTVPFCFRIDLMQSSLYLLSEAAPLHRSPQGIRRCSNPSGRCCPWCNTRPCLHGQGFGSSCGRPAHWLDSGMGVRVCWWGDWAVHSWHARPPRVVLMKPR